MRDLYDLLGVPRDAGAACLRRGYRRAAKRAHPDVGGSAAEFEMTKRALDVLSDPVRRARYDADGVIEEKPVDTRVAEAMNLIAAALDQAVAGHPAPERADLVGIARQKLAERARASRAQKEALAKVAALWGRLADKFERVGEGENLLAGMARGKVAAAQEMLARCDAEVAKVDRALAILKDYRFTSAGSDAAAYMAQQLYQVPSEIMW